MNKQHHPIQTPMVVGILVLVLAGISYAVYRMEAMTRQSASYRLDLSRQQHVENDLIGYAELAPIAVPLNHPIALCTGPENQIYIAGDAAVVVLDADGKLLRTLPTSDSPSCVAVGGAGHEFPGRIYVGTSSAVLVYSDQGDPIDRWTAIQANAVLTAIAVGVSEVDIADAANRIVMRFDTAGNRVGTIGEGPNRFVVPSTSFDLVASGNGLLHVVNPGARQIETYTSDGTREITWGRTGSGIADFFGCCNPAHLAQLPDGRFVTSEKGIPRIKVYTTDGKLDCVVAGPNELASVKNVHGSSSAYDIDVDDRGRILVLDPSDQQVRVFVNRSAETDARGN
jgi:hypothetical protein